LLELITDHNLVKHYVDDDPVRPHIPSAWRIGENKFVFALYEDQYAEFHEPCHKVAEAVICVALCKGVPKDEEDLMALSEKDDLDTAVFYTVWSYQKGAGRQIINQAQMHLHEKFGHKIKKYVTLSPLTRVAERFHLRNGAILLQKGEKCQNFEYSLPKE